MNRVFTNLTWCESYIRIPMSLHGLDYFNKYFSVVLMDIRLFYSFFFIQSTYVLAIVILFWSHTS